MQESSEHTLVLPACERYDLYQNRIPTNNDNTSVLKILPSTDDS